MIVVHQLLDFVEPFLLPAGVVRIPAGVAGFGGKMVEIPVVGVGAVVRHPGERTGRVGLVRILKPSKAGPEMFGNPEVQAIFQRRLLPFADHVAVRSHVEGVPAVQLGMPQEKIVMVGAHADKIFGARLLVEFHKALGLPFFGLPQRNDVFVTVRGGMTKAGQMVAIIVRTLLVHFTRIPVPFHGDGLRPPVRPDAKLGVAEPFRAGIVREGIHGAGELARTDRQIQRPG